MRHVGQRVGAEERYLRRFAKWTAVLLALLGALIFSMVFSATVGPMDISAWKVLGIIAHRLPLIGSLVKVSWSGLEEGVVIGLRMPRILSAAVAGMALAVAGAVFQAIFRNPMADPYILGVSSGAGFGASLAIVMGVTAGIGLIYSIPLMSMLGAVLTMLLVYGMARSGGGLPTLRLLLSGIVVSSFFSALISLIMALADESVHALLYWLFGGFVIGDWGLIGVATAVILAGSIAILLFSRELNLILLGEEQAKQLGLEVERFKKLMFVLPSVITAMAVSVNGIIGFVGLVVPHVMRLLVGPDHRILLPSSALAGATLLVLCDLLARTVLRPIVLPTGVVTALFGSPFFAYLLVKGRRIRM